MVKKHDGSRRMCVDFTDLNNSCPKDCYPLLEIDWKVESLCGYPFKCFLDAYKGYHQIQMAEEDEEKTAFHTNQGVFCYTKMSFGLKNARATYQRLVDKAFEKQTGRNLEVYVDDLVIKSHTKCEILRDIEETFHNMRRKNMKLNPKKCTFGAEEGVFLEVEKAFQNMKKCIAKFPMVTTPKPKEELIMYLSAAREAKDINPRPSLADFIAEKPDEGVPEPWVLFTDGSSCLEGSGAGLILTSPEGEEFTYALRFKFDASNNEAEYEALVAGLRIAEQMGVKNLIAKVDSRLVASQINGLYEAKEQSMTQYLEKARTLIEGFKKISIKQVPRTCMHSGSRSVVAKAIRSGYYWPKMHKDARNIINIIRACNDCQTHRPVPRNPQQKLTLITSLWPLYMWGIDISGPFPEGQGKVKFLIVVVDYFTKWIEAKPVATITGNQVKKFVWDNIVCKFWLPAVQGQSIQGLVREAEYQEKCLLKLDNWRSTGRTFTLVGNACPLTKITATNKVPLREPIPLEVVAQEFVVTKVYTRRPKVPKTNGSNSKPKIAKSMISNKTELGTSRGSNTSVAPSSSSVDLSLADKAILSGADNRLPMLEKDMYDSWKSIMELYMLNRQHGRMILKSVENGPLLWPTVEENGLRTSSNPRQQATINNGRVTIQPIQGRQNSMTADSLMANLSHYGSDNLAEVHNQDNVYNNVLYQDVQATSTSEQLNILNQSETEITSDSNIISYSQYINDSQYTPVQNSSSPALQDDLILSVIEQLKTQVVNCTKINQVNKNVNEILTAELERYKDHVKILKEQNNVNKASESSQTKLSAEQAFWSQYLVNSEEPNLSSSTTIVEVPKELPKVSMVNSSLKRLKFHLASFDVVVKERTTATATTEGTWGFKHTKASFKDEIIPFVQALKELFNSFDQFLIDELIEVQNVFNQMEHCVEKNKLQDKMNDVLKENERLLEQGISVDIVNILVHANVNSACKTVNECERCVTIETEL
nr:reverse transcriptase domain-containing protein [Tanacetum cinerariifolium]